MKKIKKSQLALARLVPAGITTLLLAEYAAGCARAAQARKFVMLKGSL